MVPTWLLVCLAGVLCAGAVWELLRSPAAARLRRLGVRGQDAAATAADPRTRGASGCRTAGQRTGGHNTPDGEAVVGSESPRWLRLIAAKRRSSKREKAGADAQSDESAIAVVDRCSELLRVGVPPVRAVSHIAGLGTDPELSRVLAKVARSLELGQAPHLAIRRHLGGLAPRMAEVLDGMAAVWFVAETSGAPAAEMLSEYGQSCRRKADSRRERDVALAGPQSTVKVLTWLPLISLGLSVLIGANPIRLLLSVPGFAALGAGAALLVLGRLWMRRMLRKAQ